MVDALQRGLEVELVDFLRQQNSQLMEEVANLKSKLESKAGSGVASSCWSTVNGGSADRHGSSACAGKRWSSRSPRPTRKVFGTPEEPSGCVDGGHVKKGNPLQFTPNGTRIPDGPPPCDDGNVIPCPPPVPPFPVSLDLEAKVTAANPVNLGDYEACEKGPKTKMGEVGWMPTSEKVLTPREAKTVWLEREVQSLKTVLEKVADGKTYDASKAWPLKDGQTVWSANLTEPSGATVMEQSGVLHCEQGRDGRALHGALHSTGLGALPQQDRALHGAASGALHSMGLGEVPHQARVSGALDGALHSTVLGGDPLQGRALHGVASGVLRSMDLGAVPQHDRALHSMALGEGALHAQQRRGDVLGDGPLQDRAQHYGVRSGLHQADLGGALPGRAQGHGALPMPSSSESSGGGAGGTKAELPELPNGATPLQFGDWLYLCGPIMRDISNVAGRWWDLTVRQALTTKSGRCSLHCSVCNSDLGYLMNSLKHASPERSSVGFTCFSKR